MQDDEVGNAGDEVGIDAARRLASAMKTGMPISSVAIRNTKSSNGMALPRSQSG